MATYSDRNYPEKKRRSGWLIGCAAGVILTICIISFVLIGGTAWLVAVFGGEPEGLRVAVTTPDSRVQVGDAFEITLSLSNVGTRNIDIGEVQLPNSLLENVSLIDIQPADQQRTAYSDKIGYDFDLLIAPTGRETIVFRFEAINAADIAGDLVVLVGTKTSQTPISMTIAAAAAAELETIVQEPVVGDVIPYQSVVQITAIVDIHGELIEAWTGSGTFISQEGLILTNAHVVLSDRYFDVVDLVVSITEAQDRPPVPKFFADVVQADRALDLAVIKLRSDLSGGPVNFSELGIEPVPLGRSENLQLGDSIIIIGYPGIGGETITLTRGEVSGFTAEEPYGNRAFIKTSATIAGGNSGGLAATPGGEIIGVPTQVGSGDIEGQIVDCRPLADTNRDGVIDERDNCVPTGGFINALRPINLAEPLIDAALAGQVAIIDQVPGEQHQDFDPEGDVVLFDDFSDNTNLWDISSRSEGTVAITGGQLVIDVFTEYYIIWSDLPDVYESLIMVVDARVLQSSGDGDFGFICGLQDDENFTALEISEDGYYTIWKFENNEYVSLVEWTYSDAIDFSGFYTLAAYCGPDGLALAVNDTLLADIFDPNYIPGRVGLAAGCWETPGFQVGFEDFVILNP